MKKILKQVVDKLRNLQIRIQNSVDKLRNLRIQDRVDKLRNLRIQDKIVLLLYSVMIVLVYIGNGWFKHYKILCRKVLRLDPASRGGLPRPAAQLSLCPTQRERELGLRRPPLPLNISAAGLPPRARGRPGKEMLRICIGFH